MATTQVTTAPMSDKEALGWLKEQGLRGPVETTARELARRFGWGDDEAARVSVGRRLQRWEKDGHIMRRAASGGRSVIMVRADTVNATVNIAVVQPVQPREHVQKLHVFTPVHPGVHHLGAAVLALIALGVAYCGLQINATFGQSLGRTPQAAHLFALLSVAADAAALVLPTAARALWRHGERAVAVVAFGLFGLVLTMALLAAVGFAATNIADITAARGKTASESASLAADIARLTSERSAIAESRSVAALDAAIAAAQGAAASVWARTSGCSDITRRDSSDACAAVLRLREARGEAARRDGIDAELRDKQAALAALPAVTAADPQADAAAAMLTWMSRGALKVGAADIAMVRIAGMTLLPQIAGLMFMLAAGLWGLPGRSRQLTARAAS